MFILHRVVKKRSVLRKLVKVVVDTLTFVADNSKIMYYCFGPIPGCRTATMHRPAVYPSQIGCDSQTGLQRSKDIRV